MEKNPMLIILTTGVYQHPVKEMQTVKAIKFHWMTFDHWAKFSQINVIIFLSFKSVHDSVLFKFFQSMPSFSNVLVAVTSDEFGCIH